MRESRQEERYVIESQRLQDLQTPALLLLGGDSPQRIKTVTEAVCAALPNGRICVMPEQQHIAMLTAPDLFLREVLGFLDGGHT